MFTFEKNMHIQTITLTSCLFIYTIVSTHHIWTRIFVIASFHSYTEFNYYEFDVDFDLHSYICKYIYTIYITFGLLCFITNKKHITYKTISIILITLAALQIINISEIVYYMIITITYLEIRNFIYIINKKRNNLYTLVL